MAVAYSPGATLLPRNDAVGPCAYADLPAPLYATYLQCCYCSSVLTSQGFARDSKCFEQSAHVDMQKDGFRHATQLYTLYMKAQVAASCDFKLKHACMIP